MTRIFTYGSALGSSGAGLPTPIENAGSLPQRTTAALEAIARSDWSEACRQMLDYYDRCYDHELERHGAADQHRLLGHEDLAGLSAETAADQLISRCVIKAQGRNAA
mgnify:CR=1 FL=1